MPNRPNAALRRSLAAVAACLLPAAATAPPQAYPVKPVRIVVGYPPGGAIDALARLIAQPFAQAFGQQFLIENRGGASGIIGADVTAKSPPDGYTLILLSGTHTVNPSLYKKLPYDTERDFAAISLMASSAYILVVHPSLPVKSVRELIAFARNNRGQVNYASSGNAGMPHLSGELFKVMSGTSRTRARRRSPPRCSPARCRSCSAISSRPCRRCRPAACARSA
jgi:tripartite-type tricarboxylate transporter receptor subunit TctC